MHLELPSTNDSSEPIKVYVANWSIEIFDSYGRRVELWISRESAESLANLLQQWAKEQT